jgi:hypothetical protein
VSSPGLRRAAVLLGSVHTEDRAWLLARLPPGQRQALAPLLEEVRRLGPVDPAVARQVLDGEAHVTELPEPPSPQHLLRGLQGLSPAWAARVLRACAPDHVDMYVSQLAPATARMVREEFSRLPAKLPAGLARALAAIVNERGRSRADE